MAKFDPENIRQAIESRGVTQRKVAQRANIDPTTLSRMLNQGANVTVKILERIANAIPCDIGEFFGSHQKIKAEPVVVFATSRAERDALVNQDNADEFQPVPLLADAAGLGPGYVIDETNIEGHCLIYKSWLRRGGKYYAIRLAGDSMEPIFSGGDIVTVDITLNNPRSLSGHFVAAKIGDGITIKRFWNRGNEWYFEAVNRDWEREHGQITSRAKERVLIGKVVWAWRKF